MHRVSMILAAFVLAVPVAAFAQVTYSNRPPPPPNQYPNRSPYYPNPPQPYPPHGNGPTINCGSSDYKPARCPVPRGWRGARLVRQTSDAACVWGRTWGFDRGTVWVTRGCSGQFAATRWMPSYGWNRDIHLACGSPQYRYAFCQVDVGPGGSVVLERQISDTRCVRGRNWGWNRAGIWVNHGCSARFRVIRRW